jgi:hypothetical protein
MRMLSRMSRERGHIRVNSQRSTHQALVDQYDPRPSPGGHQHHQKDPCPTARPGQTIYSRCIH